MEEKEIEKIAVNKIIEFAKTQPGKVWHQMMMDWNWDNYMSFIHWLIENPNTDKATILMIYWKSNPGTDFSGKTLLEENYSKGYYSQQLFAFDPENDEGDDWTAYVSVESKKRIPPMMFQKFPGENVPYPEKFIEGMPENLFAEIENLYD
ncbi:DUF4274 domain-containing protein [Niabella drilacis]|uniref:DUF4274 domain-containing protein n=1 Tax=Niabella drilacis (strain DSM 25811 / CCM 8410 / CCUG 62505 / LMG 26954 / E90) TaxID=1285928 RepID=A0A1G6UTY5_NIADE|nr:DUF4274 domain-containing protein [Niabella drilacis]SDD44759.1 protein of unknown function [Niabella drilacis]